EGEDAIFDRDLHLLFFDLWQFGLDDVLFFGFADVDRRRPIDRSERLFFTVGEAEMAESSAHLLRHLFQLLKRLPSPHLPERVQTNQAHFILLVCVESVSPLDGRPSCRHSRSMRKKEIAHPFLVCSSYGLF